MRVVLFTLILLVTHCSLLTAQEKRSFTASGDIIRNGIEFHDKGQYKDAIALYKNVAHTDTNYVWALYEMALSYATDSQYTKAKEYYELGLSLREDRSREPDIYNNYGSLLDDMGNREEAIRVLDTAIKKYPAYAQLYLNKGLVLIR